MNKNNKKGKSLFTMRMDEATRKQLHQLAGNSTYKYNKSAVITSLITAEYFKTVKNNGN